MNRPDLSPEAEYRLAVYNRQRERIAELEARSKVLTIAVAALLTVLAALAVVYLLTHGLPPTVLLSLTSGRQ